MSSMNWLVEDFIEDVPFPGQGPGREGLKNRVGGFLQRFRILCGQRTNKSAEDDKVVSRFT